MRNTTPVPILLQSFLALGLYDAGCPLAFPARQRSHDREADARPCLSKLLPAEAACTCDPHALHERLNYDILQHARNACDIKQRWIARSRGRDVEYLQGRRPRWPRNSQVDMNDR
jgi:hypothetical protein